MEDLKSGSLTEGSITLKTSTPPGTFTATATTLWNRDPWARLLQLSGFQATAQKPDQKFTNNPQIGQLCMVFKWFN